jgi:uncharacterized protein
MAKQCWSNLSVKNINRSKEFFTKLGFKCSNQHGNSDNPVCLLIGDNNVVCMLFDEATFKGFTKNEITDTAKSNEVLLSIDAQSKEEVDEMLSNAIAAGGTSSHQPSQMKGFMYGCVFADPDGHKWNVLYMDRSNMKG